MTTSRDFANDPDLVRMTGIGGTAQFIRRRVQMQLTDDQLGVVQGECIVWIAATGELSLYGLPSLMGRDITGQFKLTVDEPGARVYLELPSANAT
jgi:hypothetical protein